MVIGKLVGCDKTEWILNRDSSSTSAVLFRHGSDRELHTLAPTFFTYLLTRSLSSCWFASGLLSTSHFGCSVWFQLIATEVNVLRLWVLLKEYNWFFFVLWRSFFELSPQAVLSVPKILYSTVLSVEEKDFGVSVWTTIGRKIKSPNQSVWVGVKNQKSKITFFYHLRRVNEGNALDILKHMNWGLNATIRQFDLIWISIQRPDSDILSTSQNSMVWRFGRRFDII